MGEEQGPVQPAENKQADFDKEVNHRARKLVAAGAALTAAATFAVTASQPNRPARAESKSTVAADVRPHVTFLKGAVDPSVDKVITGPINNPTEGGNKLLEIAANTDPQKVNMNYIAYGMTMAIRAGEDPIKLYHAPFGVKQFLPTETNPDTNGKANPLVVPPHHVLLWTNPRSIAISAEVETVYAGNEENNKDKYFLTVDQAYEHNAQYLSPGGKPVHLLEVTINNQGILEINGVPLNDASVLRIVSDEQWKTLQEGQGLKTIANPPTSGH